MSITQTLLDFYNTTEAALRVRIGMAAGDDTKDALIESCLGEVLELVEVYLDRKLAFEFDEEVMFSGREAFMVRRWPIVPSSVTITRQDGQLDMFIDEIDYERGILNYYGGNKSVVKYQGGFQKLPAGLSWAMLAGFDALWAATPGYGATAGSGIITGSGAVKKVSLVGIGSVDLDVGSKAVSSGDANGGGSPWSIFPATVTTVFDRYRRESAVGIG